MPSKRASPFPLERAGFFLCATVIAFHLAVTSATAQEDSATEAHLAVLAGQCADRLEMDTEKCACVIDDARAALLPIEIEYTVIRIAENQPEIDRLREILPLGQRLRILWLIIEIVDRCADGTPYNNPL